MIDSKMLLLGFFLIPMIFVTGEEVTINNYILTVYNGFLVNVEPTEESSVELNLSGLDLVKIDELAFRNATNLTRLNLSNNRIREMPSGSVGLDNLESLDLSNNQLKSLRNVGNYGRGRCDIIIKGTPITEISYTDLSHNDQLSTPKPLVPVLMNMHEKCGGLGPKSYVHDANNENTTLSDEKIKCPGFAEKNLSFDASNTMANTSRGELCIEDGILQRISILPEGSSISKNCKEISLAGKILNLANMDIETVAKNWYRLETIKFYSIDLGYNKIASLSNNLLNDLPESIKRVRLARNKIERLDGGIISNEFLMTLDLSGNEIREIAINAFEQTNLSVLILSDNNLTDLTFVEKLPSGLSELYLDHNNIAQVPDNSFSRLNNIFNLALGSNKITELGRQSLQGLTSLQRLIMPDNGLQNIESGAFRHLDELRDLDLMRNNITEFDNGLFSDLKELIFLHLDNNNLKRITKDTFKGLPDNLRTLGLSRNVIESLEEGSFIKVPKYQLELSGNNISKLGKGAINVPTLKTLYLDQNKLSEIKEENFDLPNLLVLELRGNLVGKIERGAFRKLWNLEALEISENPIKTLQKGSLFGIKRAEIRVPSENLELIQRDAFLEFLVFPAE